jgi:hypothetical protein
LAGVDAAVAPGRPDRASPLGPLDGSCDALIDPVRPRSAGRPLAAVNVLAVHELERPHLDLLSE